MKHWLLATALAFASNPVFAETQQETIAALQAELAALSKRLEERAKQEEERAKQEAEQAKAQPEEVAVATGDS